MRRLTDNLERQTPFAAAFVAMSFVITDGMRALMMDIGFGGFLDKFEHRFGRIPTTILLVLISLSVASFCINVISTYAVSPALSLFNSVILNGPPTRFEIVRTIGVVLNICLFIFLFLLVRDAIDSRKEHRNARRITDEYAVFREFAMQFWDSSAGFYGELQTAIVYLEVAKNAKERTLAIQRLQHLLDTNKQEYSSRVVAFNKSLEEAGILVSRQSQTRGENDPASE